MGDQCIGWDQGEWGHPICDCCWPAWLHLRSLACKVVEQLVPVDPSTRRQLTLPRLAANHAESAAHVSCACTVATSDGQTRGTRRSIWEPHLSATPSEALPTLREL